MSADSVAYIRDWVIIIFGVIAIVTAVTVLVVTIVLYRKITAIIDAVLATARGVREFSRQAIEQLGALTPFLRIFRRKKQQEEATAETEEGRDAARGTR